MVVMIFLYLLLFPTTTQQVSAIPNNIPIVNPIINAIIVITYMCVFVFFINPTPSIRNSVFAFHAPEAFIQ